MLATCYTAIPQHFNMLFRALLEIGYHPKCWREGTGAILPKANKSNYKLPKAYRIITLLNCLGKIAEKLVAKRLAYLCEVYNLLHPEQLGGRQQRSAVDAALSLVHDIEIARSDQLITSALFLDVKGAFDNVSKAGLLATMQSLGIPSPLITWTNHFMSDRKIALAFDGEKEGMEKMETGIPQGSPTSPILFLIYLKPLFDKLNTIHPSLKVPSYMDDVALVATGRSEKINCKILAEAALTAFRWAEENAVAFDDSKSELMHFTLKQKEDTSDSAKITLPNGTIISPSNKALRWLGVWFDRKLSFKHHVNTKVASAKRALGCLQRLANTESGLHPTAVRQLYIACITPISDFGAEVWWRGQQGLCSKLQLLQNNTVRKVTGAFRTTPMAALESEACIPPVRTRLNYLQQKMAIRILSMPEIHPIRVRCPDSYPPCYSTGRGDENGLFNQWHELELEGSARYQTQLDRILASVNHFIQPSSDVETFNTCAIPPWYQHGVDVSVSLSSKEEEAINHEALFERIHRDPGQTLYYTDGSMLDKHVGAGLVQVQDGKTNLNRSHSQYLGTQMEVYDAEMWAIQKAVALSITSNSTSCPWIKAPRQ